jgi:hypothetical protein
VVGLVEATDDCSASFDDGADSTSRAGVERVDGHGDGRISERKRTTGRGVGRSWMTPQHYTDHSAMVQYIDE